MDYKKRITTAALSGAAAYLAAGIAADILQYIISISADNPIVKGLPSLFLAIANIGVIVYCYEAFSRGLDKVTGERLLALAFVPTGVISIVSTVLFDLFTSFPAAEKTGVFALVAGVITKSVGFALFFIWDKALIGKYVDFFFARRTLVFPPQFKIGKKWWFGFVASLISAIFSGGIFAVLGIFRRFSLATSSLNVSTLTSFALTVAFFFLAFKSIDKETRKLFYPHIFVYSTLSSIVISIGTPLSTAIGSYGEKMIASGEGYNMIISLIPALLSTGGLLILSAIIAIIIMKKTLIAFEKEVYNG